VSAETDDRTPAEWAILLEPLARRALESYEVEVADLSLITNDWNCVFRVDLVDGSRRVLRVRLPDRRTRVEIEGEMSWLAALAGGTVPVPAPMRARDGALVVEAAAEGVPQPRACAVFDWLDGERLAHSMTPTHVAGLGEGTALLHAHASGFRSPAGMKTWDSPYPFREPEVLFRGEHAQVVGTPGRRAFKRARARTVEAVARLRAAEDPRMLHADLHEDNAFVQSDGRIAILDFDDCMIGWPVQDLGITVWALTAHDGFDELEHALRQGYERVAPWPERELGEVRVFAAARCLNMANYALQDHDPGYRARASEMIAQEAATIDRLLPG
jgi:Ser/Thr protein kinase RdoA (MazF antagonist)